MTLTPSGSCRRLQVNALLNTLLLQAIDEALHADVGGFLRREIDQADLLFHRGAARAASARGEQAGHQQGEGRHEGNSAFGHEREPFTVEPPVSAKRRAANGGVCRFWIRRSANFDGWLY